MDNKQERELLDRLEKLAREAADGYVVWPNAHQIADGITQEDASALMQAMTPATVLQIISMARRATHASQQGEEDAARLDWLEEMGNAPGGLWLHEGKTGRYNQTGLGLRRLGRTLREAVDAARAAHPGWEEGGKA